MAISDSEIAQVRSATDIVALIGEYVALKKSGRRWSGLCPFHGEKTPSFSVNAEEGIYYCFGCHVSGDQITFVTSSGARHNWGHHGVEEVFSEKVALIWEM